jgi:hypothetical protein
MKHLLVLTVSAGALLGSTALSLAADTCVWTQQPDGKWFGNCVNDQGTQHCVLCPAKDSTDKLCVAVSCFK